MNIGPAAAGRWLKKRRGRAIPSLMVLTTAIAWGTALPRKASSARLQSL
ncbi:hypothetical protein [Polaromonas sp.]|nr:hypothetical protein [Burkholderiales bacterium]